MTRLPALALATLLAGCTTTYELTLMPRDSGQLYYGEATGQTGGEMRLRVTLGERTYEGTWVVSDPGPRTGFVVGGVFGSRRSGVGTSVVIDDPLGTEAKALLRSADGRGLRCDFKGVTGAAGSGICQDDQGLVYDVQLRRS
ncbi:MAG: hypothetical protein OEW96_12965 [Betaproteobacteria bacterium]|nr:hypothetical protein [Betaproteobacteria bacterium]